LSLTNPFVPHLQDDTLNSTPTSVTHFSGPSLATPFASSQSSLARTCKPNHQLQPDENSWAISLQCQCITLENAPVPTRLFNRALLVQPIPYRNLTVSNEFYVDHTASGVCNDFRTTPRTKGVQGWRVVPRPKRGMTSLSRSWSRVGGGVGPGSSGRWYTWTWIWVRPGTPQ